MAKNGDKMWMKHGAIDYKECIGNDLESRFGKTVTNMMKLGGPVRP